MPNRSRWLVETRTESIMGAVRGVAPLRGHEYFRWRWQARFFVFMAKWPVPGAPVFFSARIVGRVRKKEQSDVK